jgi:hypothetical protein
MARPSIIFGDGTKNFFDDDLLAGALRSIREVGGAPKKFFVVGGDPPTHGLRWLRTRAWSIRRGGTSS